MEAPTAVKASMTTAYHYVNHSMNCIGLARLVQGDNDIAAPNFPISSALDSTQRFEFVHSLGQNVTLGNATLPASGRSPVSVLTSTTHDINTFIVSALIFLLIVLGLQRIRQNQHARRIQLFSISNGCTKTRMELPRRFMSSIRNKFDLILHKEDLLDDTFAEKYRTYGETHALYDSYGNAKFVHTIDPVNVNALLSTN
jgi:hypothetical protein